MHKLSAKISRTVMIGLIGLYALAGIATWVSYFESAQLGFLCERHPPISEVGLDGVHDYMDKCAIWTEVLGLSLILSLAMPWLIAFAAWFYFRAVPRDRFKTGGNRRVRFWRGVLVWLIVSCCTCSIVTWLPWVSNLSVTPPQIMSRIMVIAMALTTGLAPILASATWRYFAQRPGGERSTPVTNG